MKKIVRLIKYTHTVDTDREITVEVDDDFDINDLTDEQEEIPANQEYFEDNVLRMRLVYNSKGNFVRQ